MLCIFFNLPLLKKGLLFKVSSTSKTMFFQTTFTVSQIIKERLMRSGEEPADGIPLKFTFPDGTMKIRRFQVFE